MSKRTAIDAVKQLEAKALVSIERNTDALGAAKRNTFTLYPARLREKTAARVQPEQPTGVAVGPSRPGESANHARWEREKALVVVERNLGLRIKLLKPGTPAELSHIGLLAASELGREEAERLADAVMEGKLRPDDITAALQRLNIPRIISSATNPEQHEGGRELSTLCLSPARQPMCG